MSDEFDTADFDDHQADRMWDAELRRDDWDELHGEYRGPPSLEELIRLQGMLKAESLARSERMLCWRCRGTGYVTVAGPDEFGNYDADDCPDCGGWP